MRRVLLAVAAGICAFLLPARAQEMRSEGNVLARSEASAGAGNATQASTANNKLLVGDSDAVSGSTMSSAANRLAPGFVHIVTMPGAVTNLTNLGNVSLSSVTLQWTAPGLDGALGSLQTGSSYYIRVASYTTPSTFLSIQHANVVFTTAGVAGATPGSTVSTRPAAFFPNTTWYVQVWVADNAGNVGYPSVVWSTFTTLALPVPSFNDVFQSVQDSSVTVAWNKLNDAPPDASSKTSQGYLLEISSTNFGTLSPGGVVNSSLTYAVAASTLTVNFPDPTVTTNYYRIGTLNWEGRPNWFQLGKMNFQVKPSATLITIPAIDMTANTSVVAASSFVVYNVGDTSATYVVDADTNTPGTAWTVGGAPDVDVVGLQGVWNTLPQPGAGAFTTFITSNPLTSSGGNFSGNQTGILVPPGQNRTLWFRFHIPTSTSENGSQQLRVTVVPVKP